MYKQVIYTLVFCLAFATANAQQTNKRDKQTTKFHYLQANFHSGYFSKNQEGNFDIASNGPSNGLAYRFLSKNQRQLQRGYTNFVAINSFSFRFSSQFKGSLNKENSAIPDVLRFNLQNIGLSFKTKWDRTSFFVGYNSVRFGHNPKIDPVSDFTSNITKADIGFAQDVGIFFKSPLSKKFDVELGLSTGGLIRNPIATFTQNDVTNEGKSSWEATQLDYKNTWLATARIGVPTFKPFEYGLMLLTGKVPLSNDSEKEMYRLGFDVNRKVNEELKVGGQIVGGVTKTDFGNFNNVNFQNTVEYYLKGRYVFNFSNGVLVANPQKGGVSQTRGQWINSFSYVVSPHTRVRLHHSVNYSKNDTPDWGVSVQLITGFGKR